jgi:parallel beta-helix repeat protein
VPQTISYQGSLSDAKGNPLDAKVEMVFGLYGSPTGATALWREGQGVLVTNGTFSVVLGANELNPLDAKLFQKPLYLGIAVNEDAEMKPRQALAAVGYAFQAKNAETLGGLLSSEIVAAAQDEVRTPISALPFIISAPGSYYLTGDLTLADTTAHGIMVNADDVTIDLMGFSLIGPDSGAGSGVFINGRSNVEVRDGTVRGFGGAGVQSSSGRQHRVVNVRLHANHNNGMLLLGDGHIVKDCTAGDNGSTGFNIGSSATVTGNTAYYNLGTGILAGANSVVAQNAASNNIAHGISAGTGSTVIGNAVGDNISSGIVVGSGSTVTNNTAWANNQGNFSSSGGLRVDNDSLVKGNSLNGNLQNNIFVFGEDNAIEENLVTDSTKGIQFWTTTGNFFANNRASGNTTNYFNAASQTDGGGNVSF